MGVTRNIKYYYNSFHNKICNKKYYLFDYPCTINYKYKIFLYCLIS